MELLELRERINEIIYCSTIAAIKERSGYIKEFNGEKVLMMQGYLLGATTIKELLDELFEELES